MTYYDELLEQAKLLCDHRLPGEETNQANLRRAASSAYYSLFHLLSTEASENWKHERQRHKFARLFEHGRTKQASVRLLSLPVPTDAPGQLVANQLRIVAQTFVSLQQARHTADYDHSRVWSRIQVYEEIYRAQEAVKAWVSVRDTDEAQDYLLDMLGSR
jgi:hypothetical protein